VSNPKTKSSLGFVSSRYGRKIGLLRHSIHLARYHLGSFSSLERIDWNSVRRLVFICKGNICRSAYAEAKAHAVGLSTSSLGLEAVSGVPANESAIRAARLRDVNLTDHRTRGLAEFHFQTGDLLIAMEPVQASLLQTRGLPEGIQLTLLGLFCVPPRPHLEDPFGLSEAYFATCFGLIDDAIAKIASSMRQTVNAPTPLLTSQVRSNCRVLVTDAHTLGSIACIRSLGRAGYVVHACSDRRDALGLSSRFAMARVICPSYSDAHYLNWLRTYIRENQIRVILPSEGFLLAVRQHFSEIAPLLPFSSSEEVLYSAMSKSDQIAAFRHGPNSEVTAGHLPPCLLLRSTDQPPDVKALESIGLPLYVKVDECYSFSGAGSAVFPLSSIGKATTILRRVIPNFAKVLVEGHVPGRGVGVFFLLWDGQLIAEFMHLRLHEVPHTGGASSYRESWWHQAIRDDALAKLKAMNWQGVAMMEYRWNPVNDQFTFIEMNGRFWGSLHLALFAGVDFPTMLVDAFLGRPEVRTTRPSADVRCRYTFPGEVRYVRSRLKDRSLDGRAKLTSVVEFILLGLNPRIHSDLWFMGDRGLYWKQLVSFVKEIW
jgi:protein-tyrosine-phosphatase